MFAAVFVALLAGYGVAATLGGVALLFALLGMAVGAFDSRDLGFLAGRLFGVFTNQTLLAVPLFVLMGVTLERTNIAETLLESLSSLMARLPGGLAIAVTLVGMLMAASTGIVGATVVTLGLLGLTVHAARGVRSATLHRNHLRHRHAGPDHPAFDCLGAARRCAVERLSAGTVGPGRVRAEDGVRGRPLRRRLAAWIAPGGALRGLCIVRVADLARARATGPGRERRRTRWRQPPARAAGAARADRRRARIDSGRACDAHRGGRRGGARRLGPRCRQPRAQPSTTCARSCAQRSPPRRWCSSS